MNWWSHAVTVGDVVLFLGGWVLTVLSIWIAAIAYGAIALKRAERRRQMESADHWPPLPKPLPPPPKPPSRQKGTLDEWKKGRSA